MRAKRYWIEKKDNIRRKATTVGETGAANAMSDILICEARSVRNEIQL